MKLKRDLKDNKKEAVNRNLGGFWGFVLRWEGVGKITPPPLCLKLLRIMLKI